MTLDSDTVNPPVQTARGRLLVFLVGAAVLPWLGASLTTLAFIAVTDAYDDNGHEAFGDTVRGMVSVEYLAAPLIVFVALLLFVVARDTARLRPVFAQFWAVGGLVAVVSASSPSPT